MALEVGREAVLGQQRHQHRVGAGHQRPARVDGVPRIGAQRGVARVEEREVEVEDALLRADRRHDLGVRIELDVEAAHVEVRDGLAEVRAAAVGGVLVRLGLGDRLLHRVDDDRRRRAVGVADAQRDDVDALRALGGDLALELGEQVGRDEVQALAGLHRFSSSVQKSSASVAAVHGPRPSGQVEVQVLARRRRRARRRRGARSRATRRRAGRRRSRRRWRPCRRTSSPPRRARRSARG